MSIWTDWLAEQHEAREQAGLTRRLRPRAAGEPLVDLAGNDYLGLSGHPAVIEGARAAAARWGAGAAASRLVTGTTALHAELEEALADWLGAASALAFSTGYHANLSAVSALADRETTVISDAHAHASLIDGIRLSRASVRVVPHNEIEAVAAALGEVSGRAIVVVESVYSVLGDAAPLAELVALTGRAGALLLVDEAHAIGVRGAGRGLLAELGLAGRDHVVVTGTCSKALGSQGGLVAASPQVVEHLINRARPFIFDTGLAPAAAGAALAALDVLRAEPERVTRGAGRAAQLAAAWGIAPPAGWVMSAPMPSPAAALAAQEVCRVQGVRVGCFRPPSTPDEIARLRATVNAGIPDKDWRRALVVVVGATA
ncbi:8-amino-7-oxononanoate synthase [Actinomycetota bacterium]